MGMNEKEEILEALEQVKQLVDTGGERLGAVHAGYDHPGKRLDNQWSRGL
jgi:hypothetical protein